MTLPIAPNPISLDQIRAELGITGPISFNDPRMRALAGAAFTTAGTQISLSDLRGKSNYTPMVVTAYDVFVEEPASGTAYTGTWNPRVSVASGSGGTTYLWTFTSNPSAFSLPVNNAASASITHAVQKTGFSGSATMNCRVTDNTGHIVDKVVNVNVNIYDGQIS